jgi:hypothetical protein
MAEIKTYSEYYQLAKEAYGESEVDLDGFRLKLLTPEDMDDGYLESVEKLRQYVDNAYKDDKNIFFPKGKDRNDFILRLKNPWIKEVNDVANYVIPKIEKEVLGCHAHVMGCYTYRSQHSEKEKYASWLWHWDNHPKEVIKVMVYLDNVGPKDGPFKVLYSSLANNYILAETSREDYKKWRKAHTRVTEEEIINLKNNRGGCVMGVVGEQGYCVAFDNNILHKGDVCYPDHIRDVVVFMMKYHFQ